MGAPSPILPPEHTAPSSSAGLPGVDAQTRATLCETALQDAEGMEGTRRAATLGGSLFLIPATAGTVVVTAAGFGVTGVWLGICGVAGLAIGPALCLATIAASNLVGRPLVRRHFGRRASALGLAPIEIEDIWQRADRSLTHNSTRRPPNGSSQTRRSTLVAEKSQPRQPDNRR